jgi:hypothetical protein
VVCDLGVGGGSAPGWQVSVYGKIKGKNQRLGGGPECINSFSIAPLPARVGWRITLLTSIGAADLPADREFSLDSQNKPCRINQD